jgi:phenylalanyl-tRNA synthetase beta chain
MGGIIGGAETEIGRPDDQRAAGSGELELHQHPAVDAVAEGDTDAGVRFSRGVHPSQALLGVQRGIELMRQTGGGVDRQGIIDEYPLPPEPIQSICRLRGVNASWAWKFALETAAAGF